jgi:hypothetical protein
MPKQKRVSQQPVTGDPNPQSLVLEFFRSTPSAPSADTIEPEGIDPETTHRIFPNFFDSKAVGDFTKWRLLASVVFLEWEMLLTQQQS